MHSDSGVPSTRTGPGARARALRTADMLADLGLSEFELGTIVDNLDLSSDQMLGAIADRININPDFSRATEAAFQD